MKESPGLFLDYLGFVFALRFSRGIFDNSFNVIKNSQFNRISGLDFYKEKKKLNGQGSLKVRISVLIRNSQFFLLLKSKVGSLHLLFFSNVKRLNEKVVYILSTQPCFVIFLGRLKSTAI